MASAATSKAKATAAKKKTVAPSHPPFLEMIGDAIVTLKERTGSSQYAIQKFIEEKHKQLPSTFRKLLLVQLKRFVASGKLVKVKNSFKLPSAAKAAAATAVPKKAPAACEPKVKAPVKKLKAKSKADGTAKPKKVTAGKRKADEKPKSKAGAVGAKPAKVARTVVKASPGKKVVKPKKVAVKKPKSVKSPARKAKK